ncbi:MAG: hypothetical protein ACLP5V_09150 [Candidatus Bathyarchaeia archaeon]
MSKPHTMRTRQITLAAVLAIVYLILRVVPTFSMIGISAQFTAGDFLLTSIALIAGLWSGTISVLIGTIIAYPIRPPTFLGLDFLPGVANVFIAGLLLAGKRRIAQVSYIVILVAFLASPYSLLYGYDHIPYVWLHVIALAILLSPVTSRIPSWSKKGGYLGVAAIAILAFVGTMAQHLVGGLLFESVVGYVGGVNPTKFADIWRVIFFLYPEERVIIVAMSTIIAVAIFNAYERWAPQSQVGVGKR